MQRVLEIVFSRWIQLLALFSVPIVIAAGIVMTQPRQYEASTTLLAQRRYSVVGATGLEQDLSATPASTQTTAITEILQTKSFDMSVAKDANLANSYPASVRAHTDQLESAIFDDLSTHVVATAVGYQVVSITYENRSGAVAQAVVAAVVKEYGVFAAQFALGESQQLLLIYQSELQQAKDASGKATDAVANYLRTHPAASTSRDPFLAELEANASNAQQTVASIQNQIDSINNTVATLGVDTNTLFKVVDKPTASDQPVSRTKILLTGGAIGLAVGILFCILFVVVVLRRDRSIYSVTDLQKITEAPILMQIPQLSPLLLAQTVERLGPVEQIFS